MKSSKHSILIIDDEAENLKALERTLMPVAQILTAPSGKAGLKLVKKHKISLVICDQRMPEMTGVEFFKVLMQGHPDIIRIILTGYTDAEDLIEAINQVGLYRYITKPWNNHELQLTIKRALEHYAQNLKSAYLIKELQKANQFLEKTVAKRTKELQKLSITDELTQIGNHRFFKQSFQAELQRSIRYKHDLSLLLLDIDHFKKYNDECGHAVGDKALKTTAKILKKNIRNTDLLARYGGEEFVVLLPETSKKRAVEMADRLRRAIMNNKFPHRIKSKKKAGLTISVGVSSYPTDKIKVALKLIARADKALYRAKKKGRNRIEV